MTLADQRIQVSDLVKSIYHARVTNRQRHIQASRQMANIPSFLVCTDSEKQCSDTSTLHGDDARDGGGEFVSKARPDKELEATRRKFWLNEQALSRFASVLARRSEAKKRRHDTAIRKWSTRLREGI